MDRNYEAGDFQVNTAEMSKLITDWVQGLLGDGYTVDFGRFPTAKQPCVVRQVPVAPVVKRYLNGSAICRYTFDVMTLTKTLGVKIKAFDGMAELHKIVEAVNERRFPQHEKLGCYGMSIDMLPQQYQQAEDGKEVFYVRCTINYYSEEF